MSTWSDSQHRSWHGLCLRNELYRCCSITSLFWKRCILVDESFIWKVSTLRNLSRWTFRYVSPLLHIWKIASKIYPSCFKAFLKSWYQNWNVLIRLDHIVFMFLHTYLTFIGVLWSILYTWMVFFSLNVSCYCQIFRRRTSWRIRYADDIDFPKDHERT